MLTSNSVKHGNYNSIDSSNNSIKTDDHDHDHVSILSLSVSRKDLCIYLIGIITGSLLILFFSEKLGMDYVHNNISNINNNNNKVVAHAPAIGEDAVIQPTTRPPTDYPTPAPTPIPPTTNVFISDLSSGDIVKISGHDTNQILRNPSGSNKVKMIPNEDGNRVRWEVGYSPNRDAFSFKNIEQGCYLQHGYPYLKCLSHLGDRSHWKINTDRKTQSGIKYQKLKNYGNNKCPNIQKDSDEIRMTKEFCNDIEAYVDIRRYDF